MQNKYYYDARLREYVRNKSESGWLWREHRTLTFLRDDGVMFKWMWLPAMGWNWCSFGPRIHRSEVPATISAYRAVGLKCYRGNMLP